MLNPVGGGRFNPYPERVERENSPKRVRNERTKTNGGVVIDITPSEEGENILLERRVEEIKRLLKEGKYPLDRSKLAEKILEFFTDGG